ncbi:MAG: flippase [Oscillospiraceae bacterium]|nr:flippase [Oscillospiraceae bacterium]
MKSSIRKNYLYNLGYQILQMIMPLVTAPYISRVLGTEGTGVYSYTHSVAYYFLLAGMLGVNTYGNRSVARVRDDKDKLNAEFSSIFQLQVLTSFTAIFIYICYISIANIDYKSIYMIQLLYILSATFDINWLFFGMEEFRITVTRKTIIKILTAVAVFCFVKKKEDLPIYTVIMAGGYFLGQCYLWFSVKKYVKYVRQPFITSIKHLKPMIVLFAPTIATSIYRVMDKIMIGSLGSYDDVGLYDAADKIIVVCLGVVSAWGTVMLPRISHMFAAGELEQCKKYYVNSIELITFITSAMCFGLAAIAKAFVPAFYGDAFIQSINIMRGLSITVLFIGISNTTRNQMLIPMSREKSYLISVTAGACVNFVINYIMIQQIGVMGAVIGTLCTEITVAAIQMYSVRRITSVRHSVIKMIPPILIGTMMYFVVWLVDAHLTCSLMIKIAIEIITGAAFFAFLSMLYFKTTKRSIVGIIKGFK